MGKVADMLGAVIAYLAIGTLIAAGAMFGYAWSQGIVDGEKVARIVAVVKGLEPETQPAAKEAKPAPPPPPTFDELESHRATMMRHLELREQSIKNALSHIDSERDKLLKEKQTYDRLVSEFRKEQEQSQRDTLQKGQEYFRSILESIKPKQAKELILKMVEADEKTEIVAILSTMPIQKQSKIVSEFKTEEEKKKLDEIMRLIRAGKAPANETPADAAAPPNTEP